MNVFSQKCLEKLGEDFYVYGLIDPRNKNIFYIGKGIGNRIFEHENENRNSPGSEKMKLKIISEIKNCGCEVTKIIFKFGLTDTEALKIESTLISVFKYIYENKIIKGSLTNIINGHDSVDVLSTSDFELEYGAEELLEEKILHKILVIKISQKYNKNKLSEELYDIVRGVWKANIEKVKSVDYVFGVYNSVIVAVYKPTEWYSCEYYLERKPKHVDEILLKDNKRVYFVDDNFEKGSPIVENDENAKFYFGKSIASFKSIKDAQNPIVYLNTK